MNELRHLYQEMILDHGQRPRNFGKLPAANRHAEGFNPLCGDKLDIRLVIEDDRVVDVKFSGTGCAISMASASVLTEMVKGKSRDEVLSLFERFHDMVAGEDADLGDSLEKLKVFSGVREFPMRVKCATLAWHTLKAALEGEEQAVTTE